MKSHIPAIVIAMLGVLAIILGALFKIQHWPYGSLILTIGLSLEVIVALYFIWLAVFQNNNSD
ncbi:hypothetical protein AB9K26_00505 [Psychroserpens sp. XS_ASV72]|uniref:GldL-related protein n=1 Tax=Psychroserpens sp. XS_ASV72 TaxID=3241293 RepID=UPI00351642F1